MGTFRWGIFIFLFRKNNNNDNQNWNENNGVLNILFQFSDESFTSQSMSITTIHEWKRPKTTVFTPGAGYKRYATFMCETKRDNLSSNRWLNNTWRILGIFPEFVRLSGA